MKAIALGLCLWSLPAAGAAAADAHGVRELYPSAPGGLSWSSRWEGSPRSFRGADPVDPWLVGRGDGRYETDGSGVLKVSGPTPRLYIRDPAGERDWGDVELTVYAMRVEDDGTPWGGIVGAARTNHAAETKDACDTRGLMGRLRHDGSADFEKETRHPKSTASRKELLWPDGLPKGVWLGYKHVVYDLPDGRVRQELWLDESDGRDGGAWRKVHELVDDGRGFGEGKGCARGVDPALPLRKGRERAGSESGRPNAAVYWRSDGVGPSGLLYKRMSVREIDAARAASPEARGPLASD